MRWIEPTDAEYDEQRALFNAMVDRRPAVIARCSTAEDVRAALDRARTDGLSVAVRSGGHSVAGHSTNDGGLVVDVRPMKEIRIDPDARRARVGAGVTWGEFDPAAQEHGLAVTGGRASTTGVAGFTLGGGSGWLERSLGLAADNLVAIELVTVDGRVVRADSNQNSELLWASRGGGGNFGVVTALEFDLYPVGPLVTAGLALWPADLGRDIVNLYRDWAFTAPEELGSGLVFVHAPPEEFVPEHLRLQPVVAVAALWTGDRDTGEDVLRPLRDAAPDVDLISQMPYAAFNSMLDDPPGMRHYWSADYHDDFPDAAVDVFVKSGLNRPSPTIQQSILAWGGAVARGTDSPLGNRSSRWVTHPFATWADPSEDESCITWAKQFRADIAPYATGGAWLNFIGDEGDARIAASFGAQNYARLQAVKAEFDPANLLRGNQNIRPAT